MESKTFGSDPVNPVTDAKMEVVNKGKDARFVGQQDGKYDFKYSFAGLTKRELFAAMALQGFCANKAPDSKGYARVLAERSVWAADELIKSLNEQ